MYKDLGMTVAVVGAITLGIIVDDTIHKLTKYKTARTSEVTSMAWNSRYGTGTVVAVLLSATVGLLLTLLLKPRHRSWVIT